MRKCKFIRIIAAKITMRKIYNVSKEEKIVCKECSQSEQRPDKIKEDQMQSNYQASSHRQDCTTFSSSQKIQEFPTNNSEVTYWAPLLSRLDGFHLSFTL